MSSSLTFAIVGCGVRGRTYMRAALELGHRVNAIADISPPAINAIQQIIAPQNPLVFESGEELLASKRLADVALISTQDAQHFQHASMALRLGYDVLLEKPAAQNFEEAQELARLATANNCKLILCFVLRYSPFFQALKKTLDAGTIGQIISIQSSEGVGPWHHSHAFVRGKWAHTAESTPMIVAKCCHDTDILNWIAGAPAATVTSHQACSFFQPSKAPQGATDRCTDACPHLGSCRFDAHRYLTDQRHWLASVHPDAAQMDDPAIIAWLKTSDWGRCAYRCGQDTPDHQIVGIQFENGVTATHTMTAFDNGRKIRVFGTQGILDGILPRAEKEPRLEFVPHEGPTEQIPIGQEIGADRSFWQEQWHGHGEGDFGLIASLPELLADRSHDPRDFLEGHRIGFAANQAARTKK
ncbi:MAG: Gfo/Idh/MocA family protein [Verrucomicrobiaceae bacterium]